ncbi:Ark- serine/threonine protein kinase [Yamadazyma tenuis]|uniref:Kinase-like protein n=1 Tax=Candida tenuis (strain ATCC 10573 / BCRC 21748 / CBS 615 / JCM 9827 / NBRC 10315 / NRRL Y-1498 / VKM Y-70) TaxID=590646 RepID=G3BCR4_CANTC|nr:kinase-like protein [Yamadazyma tenuis ATCC 10573]EGV60861.1 kinase-like protein [Yamadazyma tenuis ATCC 10573]WEJ93866.1 Ark- serine/threonine protein kinase [Yamadazyma tenuis]
MEPLKKLPEGTKMTVGSHKITILSYLSEGGFAHIYKVQMSPKEDDSDIACLKRVIVPDKSGLDQLRKEVDVMKKLRLSRCVVRYFDSHAERLESGAYQVLVLMELCPHGSLLDYMNAKIKTKLTESEILSIMFDISIGVYEMHRSKMIHRDIKIENVLINAHHRFKLGDFGSTSSPLMPPTNQQEFQALAHDITYQTTPQYRSPEMIDLYRNLPIDEKSDIWALGCFLYKLCYYTTPFEANGDIAILHASFQFPPAPVYSGDLKNLIIIMLQENPFFRPNIVQVIKLVCKMTNADFKTLKIQDIYKVGSYDFQALHDYQQKKQKDLLQQQQDYFEQQKKLQQQQIQPQPQPQAESLAPSAYEKDFIDPEVSESDDSSTEGLDTTLGDLADLEDVEQRYPSLENIIVENDAPKSGTGSIKSAGPKDSKIEKSAVPPLPMVPNYPVQPPILSSHDLQRLTPEQLQQYNYSHQAYQYQLSHWMSYQQAGVSQQYLRPEPNKEKYSTEFEKKEAWEKRQPSMGEEAEKLVDDIFGSKSRSPTDVLQIQQKTSQSIKSEPAGGYLESEDEEDVNVIIKPAKVRLSKSNNSSELSLSKAKPEPSIEVVSDTKTDQLLPTDLKLLRKDNFEKKEVAETRYEAREDLPVSNSTTGAFPKGEPMIKDNRVSASSNYLSQPLVSNPVQYPSSTMIRSGSGKNLNPFPVNPRSVSEANFSTDGASDSKKFTNPWGDYRSTQHLPKASQLSQQVNSLSISDNRGDSSTPKKPSTEEPNLINLEIGLDSESSLSTPIMTSTFLNPLSDSLIDLDLDDKFQKPSDRPHFKKKVPSISNPSDFRVQEEVIDWASDDEDPEQMNRLAIRSSLKKSARRSGEHKRSESTSGESKKRLSRLIQNS